MSSRLIAHLAHVEVLTPKPEESLPFYTDVLGLVESGRAGQSVYLRAWGEWGHHSLQLTEAPQAGLGHVGWRTWSPEDLESAVALGDGEAVRRVATALGAGEELEHVPAVVRPGAEHLPGRLHRRQRAQVGEGVLGLLGAEPVRQRLEPRQAPVPVVEQRTHARARTEQRSEVGHPAAQDEPGERSSVAGGEGAEAEALHPVCNCIQIVLRPPTLTLRSRAVYASADAAVAARTPEERPCRAA